MKQNFTIRQGVRDGVEAFLAVASQRNFRKAAAALGVTPSAVSQAIRTLEARIGAALFMRTTRSAWAMASATSARRGVAETRTGAGCAGRFEGEKGAWAPSSEARQGGSGPWCYRRPSGSKCNRVFWKM